MSTKCGSCGYLNKPSSFECEICFTKIREPEPEVKYQIPKKSKKQQIITDDDNKFYRQIWEEREHKSEISGDPLGDDFNVCFFSHILTKKSYPRFRHHPKNIMLMTFLEHQAWEFGDRKHPMWKKARDREEELKIEYYNQPTV